MPKQSGCLNYLRNCSHFHLDSLNALTYSNTPAIDRKEENRKYEHLTYHSLHEPKKDQSVL